MALTRIKLRPVAALVAAVVLAACGPLTRAEASAVLRLGYFPNLTHSPALVGVSMGLFAEALGRDTTFETHTFNAGPAAVTALLSGSIDAAFIGPNPTTNAYVQSHAQAVRVVAGATSGGALLVVSQAVRSVADLKGKRIADPQLGGTQDVSLRWFLKTHGFHSDTSGGGDVSVMPQDNAQTLNGFKQGQVDGAWVPEPWASRLVVEGGGHVLVDERDLWPGGQFVTTNLVVSTVFLREHHGQVKALLEGLYRSVAYLAANPAVAQKVAADAVTKMTGQSLKAAVIEGAWPHMLFTLDPLASTLKQSADHAHDLGLLGSVKLAGLYDLSTLNEVMAEHGQPPVEGL